MTRSIKSARTRGKLRPRGLAVGAGVLRRPRHGPVSRFDRLPEEVRPDLAAAFEEAKQHRRPKSEILADLNAKLAARGIEPFSRHTFNERTLWLETHAETMLQMRDIATVMAAKLQEAGDDNSPLMINEMIKSILFDVLAYAQLTETVSLEMISNAATMLGKLESARKISFALRGKVAAKANAAVESAGAAKGLTAEQVVAIKSQILGIDFTQPPYAPPIDMPRSEPPPPSGEEKK